MQDNILIFLVSAVFVSQILVLSFLMPFNWHQQYVLMFTRYPPELFPRLYPIAKETIARRLSSFRIAAIVVGLGSSVVLVLALLSGARPPQVWRAMTFCLTVQSVPWCMALILDAQVRRAFLALPAPGVRSVDMHRWGLTDFVSRLSIGMCLAGQVSALACAVLMRIYHPGARNIIFFGVTSSAWLLLITHLLLGHVVFFRADPYMTSADTFRARQQLFRRLFFFGTLYGVFGALSLLVTGHVMHLRLAYLAIGVSIFFQLRAMVGVSERRLDLEVRNFSVYRNEAAVPAAP